MPPMRQKAVICQARRHIDFGFCALISFVLMIPIPFGNIVAANLGKARTGCGEEVDGPSGNIVAANAAGHGIEPLPEKRHLPV